MASDTARFALTLDLKDTGVARHQAQQTLSTMFPSMEHIAGAGIVEVTSSSAADTIRDARLLGRRAQRAIGAGRSWVGLARILAQNSDRAVREAWRSVEIGKCLFAGPRAVLYEDLMIADFVSRDRDMRERLASILDPVLTYDRTNRWVLISTLSEFIDANLSAHAAARRLRIHRHTVDYRIRRIETLLGRSIKSSQDLMLIEISLLANRLLGRIRPHEIKQDPGE